LRLESKHIFDSAASSGRQPVDTRGLFGKTMSTSVQKRRPWTEHQCSTGGIEKPLPFSAFCQHDPSARVLQSQ